MIICSSSFNQESLLAAWDDTTTLATRLPWLVIEENREEYSLKIEPQLHQEVYFLRESDAKIIERYYVNGLKAERTVARMSHYSEGKITISGKGNSFLERRSGDLLGARLRGAVGRQDPYLTITERGWPQKKSSAEEPLSPIGQDQVGGIFRDVLVGLQRKMNFSVDLLVRNDGLWGYPGGNGTWNGMVENLLVRRGGIYPTTKYRIEAGTTTTAATCQLQCTTCNS